MKFIITVILLLYIIKPGVLSPIAFQQLVILNTTGDSIIQLGVYDKFHPTKDFTFYIVDLPANGTLRQLSQVYSNYGYNPIAGYNIQDLHSKVSDKKNRVYYISELLGLSSYDFFSYIAVNKKNGEISNSGRITMVKNDGIISESNFIVDTDGWVIVGNKEKVGEVIMSPTSISSLISHYIYGSDNVVNRHTQNINDKSLWYFKAPNKFTGNKAVAYGGYISFNIASFSGDFSKIHSSGYAVILECDICNTYGFKIGLPISKIYFIGKPTSISIMLTETAGWLDINYLRPLSKCEFIYILSNLSSIKILGDWTSWYETIALDNVVIQNKKSLKLPICYGIC